LKKPVIIRYPRGGESKDIKFEKHQKIEEGKAEIIKEGTDVSILAIGNKVESAMKLAEKLKIEKLNAEVINVRFLKPLDKKTIKESIEKTKNVITIEDGTIINGLATAVKELIVDEDIQNVKLKTYAYPDEFIKHGSVEELEEIYGMML
jgi:1-deoxy-D-xylulose-5-phosphate synthase